MDNIELPPEVEASMEKVNPYRKRFFWTDSVEWLKFRQTYILGYDRGKQQVALNLLKELKDLGISKENIVDTISRVCELKIHLNELTDDVCNQSKN